MKKKSLFHFNILENKNTKVWIIIPELNDLTFEHISNIVELLEKFEKINILCSYFSLSFHKLMLTKSKSFIQYKDRINIDFLNPLKINEIQKEDCLIIDLLNKNISFEQDKKAIYCSLTEKSDIVFDDIYKDLPNYSVEYLKSLLNFLNLEQKNNLKNIELNSKEIIEASSITSKLSVKSYHVIIIKNILTEYKIINFLKKNTLQKHLILISKHKINIDDPKILTFKEYSFLDYLAFELQAVSIACPKSDQCRNVISNLRINLSLFTLFKDYSLLLYDISEPKINDKDNSN